MRTVTVRPVESVEPTIVKEVGRTFGGRHVLADLMRWGFSQSPVVQITEIVTQDEYTYDVVLPFRDVYLSFDTT